MAFKLGNVSVKEVIQGVFSDHDGDIQYVLDQLQNASVDVTADSKTMTDKNGATIKTTYTAKSATFTATSALLSPVLLGALSGSGIEYASEKNVIVMPKIVTAVAGTTVDVSDAKTGTIHVIGTYNTGAVAPKAMTASEVTAAITDGKLKLPEAKVDEPDNYVIRFDRDNKTGIKITNKSNEFPKSGELLLYVALMDACDDKYHAAYIQFPNFVVDPNVTIPFDPDTTTVDYKGVINTDYCECSANRVLYNILIPDEEAVIVGECPVATADTTVHP